MDEQYPLEYIHGEVEFFGRKFFVSPHVLIPRLETEALVRHARAILREKSFSLVVDIGTGSGIIGTSCADLAEQIAFLDISKDALNVAERNFTAIFPEKAADFIVSDLLANLSTTRSSYLLLANLPYIKDADWGNMSPDTRHEPELALFGGEETGFELYGKLFAQIQERDIHGTLLIEFGFDQREIAEKVLRQYDWKVVFFADFAGIERFAEIQF